MDFGDFPTQSKSISWKRIAIIAGGLVIATVILVVVFRMIGNKESSDVLSQPTQTEQKKTAEKLKDADACKSLEGEGKDDCVWKIANETQDIALCKKITQDEYILRCQDGIQWNIAVQSGKEEKCDTIQDEGLKSGCHLTIQGPITTQNCAERGQDPEFCKMLDVVFKANQAQDADLCDVLKDPYNQKCRFSLLVDDPDFDGLDTRQETLVYKTDPRKSDTDGDGYNDKQEIDTGHDPLRK